MVVDLIRRQLRPRDIVTLKRLRGGGVVVIRYEGLHGGSGMREMLSTMAAIYGQGEGETHVCADI